MRWSSPSQNHIKSKSKKMYHQKSSKFHIPFNPLSNQSIKKLDRNYTDHNYIIIIVISFYNYIIYNDKGHFFSV